MGDVPERVENGSKTENMPTFEIPREELMLQRSVVLTLPGVLHLDPTFAIPMLLV